MLLHKRNRSKIEIDPDSFFHSMFRHQMMHEKVLLDSVIILFSLFPGKSFDHCMGTGPSEIYSGIELTVHSNFGTFLNCRRWISISNNFHLISLSHIEHLAIIVRGR